MSPPVHDFQNSRALIMNTMGAVRSAMGGVLFHCSIWSAVLAFLLWMWADSCSPASVRR